MGEASNQSPGRRVVKMQKSRGLPDNVKIKLYVKKNQQLRAPYQKNGAPEQQPVRIIHKYPDPRSGNKATPSPVTEESIKN